MDITIDNPGFTSMDVESSMHLGNPHVVAHCFPAFI